MADQKQRPKLKMLRPTVQALEPAVHVLPSQRQLQSQPKGTTARGYGWAWQKVRKQALARDNNMCLMCLAGKPRRVTLATEVDHVVPKHLGGTDALANLQSACTPCHEAKSAEEGSARLGFR